MAILEMLRRGPITARDAYQKAECLRLAARIYDLRNEGHEIYSEMVEDGDGVRVAKYWLVRERTEEAA